MTTNQIHKHLEMLKRVKDAHLSNQESIEVLEELIELREWMNNYAEEHRQCNLM